MQPLPSFYCDLRRTIYIIIGLTVSSDFFCLLMKSEQLRSLPFIIFLDTPSIAHGTHSFPRFCQKIGGTSSIGFLLSVTLSFLHLYYIIRARFCPCANRPKMRRKVLLAQPRLPWYTESVGDKTRARKTRARVLFLATKAKFYPDFTKLPLWTLHPYRTM